MEEFKINGICVLEKMTKTELNQLIHDANVQYHSYVQNDRPPILSDAEYDIAKDYLQTKYPDAPVLREVGADITFNKQKVTLPIQMQSMNKIKPSTDALSIWKQIYKGDYVLSCKLDGVSGLYYTLQKERKLYTRGNGNVGQDVSHLLKCIQLPVIENIIVRGEFILSKRTFETKYKEHFANTRNMVAGIVNRKSMDEKTNDVEFIAYEVIHPILKPSEQMDFLRENGFNTVQNETTHNLTNDFLSSTLTLWRNNYLYDIDGIIVCDNNIYPRQKDGNPEHAFAFKMVISDQFAETQVVDVIWNASKDGYLKPRVRVNPVYIGGVKIEYATGFNGQYIETNKIGIGAIIQIIRSGDVIPYIQNVIRPAENAKMPDVPYKWTDSRVDILLTNTEDDPMVLEKRITAFFTGMDVDGLSSGNVKRLMQAGYDSVAKIIHMNESEFLNIEGFQDKMAHKICSSIQKKIQDASLVKIICASGTLGRGLGEKKLKPIFVKYPNILSSTETPNQKKLLLVNVNGIGKENAQTFVDNIPFVLKFLRECQLQEKLCNPNLGLEPCPSYSSHPLFQKKIVFTGFRDKPLMEVLERQYKVSFVSTITKSTDLVVAKTLEESNKKIDSAKSMGIPVLSFNSFRQRYHL